jgi:hypothetical protein
MHSLYCKVILSELGRVGLPPIPIRPFTFAAQVGSRLQEFGFISDNQPSVGRLSLPLRVARPAQSFVATKLNLDARRHGFVLPRDR